MRLRNMPSRIFYAPLCATEAALNKLYVLSRYADNLFTAHSVKTRKPSRYRQLTAARIHEDIKRNGKAPPPIPTPAVPNAPSAGKGRNAAKDSFADDFVLPPPRSSSVSGENPIPYSRWAWLSFMPG